MKARFWDRVLLAVYMVLMLCFWVFAVLWVWECFPYFSPSHLGIWVRIGITAGCVLLFIATLRLLFARGQKPLRAVLVGQSAQGALRVTVPALEQIAQQYAKDVESVSSMAIRFEPSKEGGIDIQAKLTLAQGAVIPEVTQMFQQGLQAHMETHTGLKVAAVHVLVEAAPAAAPAMRVE
nr:alkaline shock response membrane anchor protein AmaP [bacterium]